jgi:hypothetical protein
MGNSAARWPRFSVTARPSDIHTESVCLPKRDFARYGCTTGLTNFDDVLSEMRWVDAA